MKKLLALLLAVVMVFSLVACATQPASDNNSGSSNSGSSNNSGSSDNGNAEGLPDAAALVSDAFIDPLKDWAQYDALIAQIKSETDFAKRAELMHKAEDILMATNCVIPLYYYNDIYLQKSYVDGIYSNPYATKFFMFTKLSNGENTLRLNLASEPDTSRS